MSGAEVIVRGLNAVYLVREGTIKAASNVTLRVEPGSVTALVGESGSGKSTVVEAITRTLPSNAKVLGGSVLFKGVDLLKLSEEEYRQFRWREISYVPQAAQNSLNPLQTVFEHFADTYADVAGSIHRSELYEMAAKLLESVGLDAGVLRAYPHQLSGGMKQRILIALSFLFKPSLVVMDEPVTALDVVNQSLVLGLISDLHRRYGTSILLVTHDLPVAGELADRIAVMYAGHLIEMGSNEEFFEEPLHPYSKGLVRSMIAFSTELSGVRSIPGEPPSLLNPPKGCSFHPRCPRAMDICREQEPPLLEVGGGRWVKCWLYGGKA